MSGYVIGMDEAGLGPNLGPLVITATVWEVADVPQQTDFWSAFQDVLTNAPARNDPRFHLADSKDVYSPTRGIGSLERTVFAALRLIDRTPATLSHLLNHLTDSQWNGSAPWWKADELPLPCIPNSTDHHRADMWREACEKTGIRLKSIQSEVIPAERFNGLIDQHGNKSLALSRVSLSLLRRVWSPEQPELTLIIADKHGGRNRYDDLLDEIADGTMIFRLQEGKESSIYRIGKSEIRFQMKAESHLPVALASLVCKYVRELSMDLFNQFWQSHVENLKPTKGYPQDARRFRADIALKQEQLGISDSVLWRCR
ncbi:MAG: hypothetical protein Tsb009_17730 [Planctomycetaceae bacterium]